jgi:hypothetical protein
MVAGYVTPIRGVGDRLRAFAGGWRGASWTGALGGVWGILARLPSFAAFLGRGLELGPIHGGFITAA